MSQLFYLSTEQMKRISPFFPLSHGIPRVDDIKVISGIIYVIKHGLQWKDAPHEYGPHKTLYNRFVLMIDATHLKAHRTAASLLKKGLFHAASDAQKAV
jgi:transposase